MFMMMKNNINECIDIYKNSLQDGNIQKAYFTLTKYVSELKYRFPKEYKTGNISFGYLDYTYFPFFNDFLRGKKLRFGIVLNHKKIQIELWLMGQNRGLQEKYWDLLKDTKWNEHIKDMPKYSVLELCLDSNLDFNNKDVMTDRILERVVMAAKEIEKFIQDME